MHDGSSLKLLFYCCLNHDSIIKSVQQWLDTVVVGLNLCPFAKRELDNHRVRLIVAEAETEEQLLDTLQAELELLSHDDSIETTLLIHPAVLTDFHEYNEFLAYADSLLEEMEFDGVYQIASFHPDYQFDGTEPDDVENYSNRSPWPILHILREASLERAIASHPGSDQIPEKNIALLKNLGRDKAHALLQSCFTTKTR